MRLAVGRRRRRPFARGEILPAMPENDRSIDADQSGAPPPRVRIVEALLFVGGAPLTAARACETIRGLSEPQFGEVVATLNADYRAQGRAYSIQAQGDGYVMALRPRFRSVLE